MTDSAPRAPDDPPSSDPRAELERLVSAALDAAPNPAEDAADSGRLQALLSDDPAALEAYLDQMQAHALLQWRHGLARPQSAAEIANETASSVPRPQIGTPPRPRISERGRLLAASAAVLALAAAFLVWVGSALNPTPGGAGGSASVKILGEVADAQGVTWGAGQEPLAAGDPVRPGTIAIESGVLHLKLASDVRVAASGPARFDLVSAMRLRAGGGRITARVGPAGKGFTVESPTADVVDLGTEFGVQVDDRRRTDVVVFEGEVDLHRREAPRLPGAARTAPPAATRMRKGEGLHVGADGGLARLWTVAGALGGADWAVGAERPAGGVVESVRDDLRDPGSQKYYRIVPGGLQEDAPAYVDRAYQWNGVDASGIPPELRGAELVMTFNDDKKTDDFQLTLVLARPAALYVFLRDEGLPPDWLLRDFDRTPLRIGMDEGPPDRSDLRYGVGPGKKVDVHFTVWKREVRTPGPATLGGNARRQSMYGVAVAPLE